MMVYGYRSDDPCTHTHTRPQEVRKEETFMPITTGVIPPQRVLDEEEDVCEYLYAEGMASLKRCVVCLKVDGRWTFPTTSIGG